MDRRRRQLGYTRLRWAQIADVPPQYLTVWLQGRCNVRMQTFNRLAESLGLDLVLIPQEMREQVQALGKKR